MMTAGVDSEEISRELASIVGAKRVSIARRDLRVYARDMWPRLLLALRAGDELPSAPHAVVWPESAREIAAIVRWARERRVPIVPYGGGSGVCGGAIALHGGITIDMKRMNKLVNVDRDELTCEVEAGANGERFERDLQGRGYTLGHFPSSIYCSTVGGWLACRAAGQLSTKYGKIEDRVVGLTAVTGRGEIIQTDRLARAHRGPNWTQIFVGSEGTLGLITAAQLRISPAPALMLLRGFDFDDVGAGLEAIRRVMQRGLRPAVLRLYDEVDSFLHSAGAMEEEEHTPLSARDENAPRPGRGEGALPRLPLPEVGAGEPRFGLGGQLLSMWRQSREPSALAESLRRRALSAALGSPKLANGIAAAVADKLSRRGCRLIVALEGPRIRTSVEAKLTFGELELAGGRDRGEEPGRQWLEHRYAVSYKMSKVFRDGAFVDTMEVASTWDRLRDLYRSVKAAIGQHAVVMAHFSHAYSEGCSIYFTFVGHGEDREASERIYDAIWRDGMHAVSRAGGTISHHHGIGLLKGPYMEAEHREAMAILHAIKKSADPAGIMNPGKLGLPARGLF